MIADVAERFLRFLGHISERQAFENTISMVLFWASLSVPSASLTTRAISWLKAGGPLRALLPVQHVINFWPVIKLSQTKVVSPVHAPMIGILQQPHF